MVMQCCQSWRVQSLYRSNYWDWGWDSWSCIGPFHPNPPRQLGLQHYNIILIPKQSLDVVGLKELEILYAQIFANHLEFGNNDIIVWKAVQFEPCRYVDVGDAGVGCIILAWHVLCVQCAVPWHQSNLKGGGADLNLRGSNNNIRAQGSLGRGGLVGQRADVIINLGSQYYDSKCINWLLMGGHDHICITCLLFTSQAWSLHHRIDRARPRK